MGGALVATNIEVIHAALEKVRVSFKERERVMLSYPLVAWYLEG